MSDRKIIKLQNIGSTNNYAKDLLKKGAKDGTVVLADEQSSGKGRGANRWSSPAGENVYLSICLKPSFSAVDAMMVPLLTPVSIVETINGLYNIDAKIKWPNDILINKKKISGILIELSTKSGNVEHLIVGIGLNLNMNVQKDLPCELHSIATSISDITGKKVDRNEFVKELLANFDKWYQNRPSDIIEAWKELSCTLGKNVDIKTSAKQVSGLAVDISSHGALMVQTGDGLVSVSSGEIIMTYS